MRKPITTALPLVFVALLGLLGTACGGDDDDGGGEAASGSDGGGGDGGGNQSMEDAAVEYAECMRENGIDMPDPQVSDGRVRVGGPGGGGAGFDPNSEEFQAAQEACQSILQEAGGQQGQADPEQVAEMRDRAAAMGDCMRSRGYEDFEDPQVDDNGGIRMTGNGPENGDDEQFQTDLSECEEESGMGGIGGGG
jgi:hypothetical protein